MRFLGEREGGGYSCLQHYEVETVGDYVMHERILTSVSQQRGACALHFANHHAYTLSWRVQRHLSEDPFPAILSQDLSYFEEVLVSFWMVPALLPGYPYTRKGNILDLHQGVYSKGNEKIKSLVGILENGQVPLRVVSYETY